MAAGEETDHGEPDDPGLADQCAADVLLEPADQVEGIGHGLPLYTGRSRDRRDRWRNKLRMVWPGQQFAIHLPALPVPSSSQWDVVIAVKQGRFVRPGPPRRHRGATTADTVPVIPAQFPPILLDSRWPLRHLRRTRGQCRRSNRPELVLISFLRSDRKHEEGEPGCRPTTRALSRAAPAPP